MLLLEVNNLSCSRQRGGLSLFSSKRKQILRDVSFRLEQGETFGLIGGSGTGKTTLAKCVAGLLDPDAGSITLQGVNVFPKSENRKKFPLAIQIVFQAGGAAFNPKMTMEDALAEAIAARSGKGAGLEQSGEAAGFFASVGLSADLLRRFPYQLSGGQRQRAAIARVLAVRPLILILDEPTSALDAITQSEVLALLQSLQAEHQISILFITHDIPAALRFCDRIAILHEGTIVEEGPSSLIIKQPRHDYTRQLLFDSGLTQL